MSAPAGYAADLDALPRDLTALCKVVQGLLIHRDLAQFLYRLKLSDQRREEAHTRPLAQMLNLIHQLEPGDLTVPRAPAHRMVSVCRHFSLMLCGFLRRRNMPARARCGFAAYLNPSDPGRFEDHWVTEYWNDSESRWVLVDAQLDAVLGDASHFGFDPLDVPRNRFVVAGDAWQMCRSGRADPAAFGLSFIHLQGLWFVAGNLVRDLASLNRVEMLPWDVWGAMPKEDTQITAATGDLFDRVAAVTLGGDAAFREARAVYESDDRLRVPATVFNALRNVAEAI
jgi:hypothetical protein